MAERKKPKRKAVKPRRRRVTTAKISNRLIGIASELDQLRARIEDVAAMQAKHECERIEAILDERLSRLEKKLDAIGMMLASVVGEEASVEGGPSDEHADA